MSVITWLRDGRWHIVTVLMTVWTCLSVRVPAGDRAYTNWEEVLRDYFQKCRLKKLTGMMQLALWG